MNIGLDFDGVIFNSHPLKSMVAEKRFGIKIPPERYRREFVVGQDYMTGDAYRSVGEEAMGGTYPIPPVQESLVYIPLLQAKHTVRVVTSRTGDMLSYAEQLLQEHGLTLPATGVGYRLSKESACRDLDVYVDDDLEKLIPLIGVVPNLFFFSWPWNIDEQEPEGIVRVQSWWELYNYIHYEVTVTK